MRTFLLAVFLCSISAWAQTPRPFLLFDTSGNPFPSGTGSYTGPTPPPFTCYTNVGGTIQGCNFAGGGGSLPSASTGQILSNTNGGQTYAGQGQILYNQTGDTIASIETACSSLCTYIVTVPQTFTLAANHTLSSNVQLQFMAGGQWTVNGAFTLTIPGNVTGTLNQHFAGTSTIAFGNNQAFANVEWFGAVADSNATASTGTDNTTAIQACLSAVPVQCVLQLGWYKVTSALSITRSNVGILGQNLTVQNTSILPNTASSAIITTSASADILDVAGTSTSANIGYNKFEKFTLARNIIPTGTAKGLSLSYTSGVVVDRVTSEDSIYPFYIHASGSIGTGYIANSVAQWGYNGVVETTGTLAGFYTDSTDGNPSLSFRKRFSFAAAAGGVTSTTYGDWYNGTAVNDQTTDGFESAGLSYGQAVTYTGAGGTDTSADIHFNASTNDSFKISGFYISGISSVVAALGSVDINGGYAISAATSGNCIDIQSSSGVTVRGVQVGGTCTKLINATGSTHLVIAHNTLLAATTNGITLSGTISSAVESNTLQLASATTGINVVSSSANDSIIGNIIAGSATTGLNLDSSTLNITGLYTNILNGTWTTDISNSSNSAIVIKNLLGTTSPAADLWIYDANTATGNLVLLQNPSAGGAVTMTLQNNTGQAGGLFLGGSTYATAAYRNAIWLYNGIGDTNVRASGNVNLYAGTSGTPATADLGISSTTHVAKAGTGVLTPIYTVATLPAASSLPAGTQVTVSDANSFTPGTCTGSGTDYMIAITNATSWSCH